ncbi:NADH-cytochrome b5 reductase 1 [Polychytrium aggregatum]|uniref:NADH-cytochrome b5 reductase 1 n=1 Tax=Polychytrium aggregatum TaxID=110093 RepID=UPI0022FDCB03|nr:NADH-cytochrome b5 reductase 1 [Polychytrium aggregatum]KAI9204011.1 NADH-cytochrome b5 reductase 1 [Polychytrium aggregatum]
MSDLIRIAGVVAVATAVCIGVQARTEVTFTVAGVALGLGVLISMLKDIGDVPVKKALTSIKEFKKFPLIERLDVSPNTAIYRFKLPTPTHCLGLPIGQHISIRADIDGKTVTRSYTPISSDSDLGHFDLLIKTYPNGNISKYVSELEIGDSIEVAGPKGFFNYTPNMVKSFGMIAGGTGITPMYQIIKAIFANPKDKTDVYLIYANVSVEDILLKQELDELAEKHANFHLHYVLNNPPANWTGSTGFVTKDIIAKHCPKYADDVKVLLCGPPPMIKALQTATEELGFPAANAISKTPDAVFKF